MFDEYSDEPIFNVKAVATQSGVQASTLRAWERRYGVPQPPRSDSGYRLYSARDAAIVRWLKHQIEGGMSISQAVNLLHSIQAGRQSHKATPAKPSAAASYSDPDNAYLPAPTITKPIEMFDRYVSVAFNCALHFDEAGFDHVLGDAFALYSVEAVCARVIQPLQTMIGEGWHKGTVTISVEHFATNLLRRKLIGLFATCPPPTDLRKIVAGCAPEEFHEMGILMLSLYLRRRGKDVVLLGQASAADRLAEMLVQTQPRLVLMSASVLHTAANLLDIVDVLDDKRLSSVIFAYGGRVFNQLPELSKSLPGVHVADDMLQALDQINALLDAGELYAHRGGHKSAEAKQALTDFKLSRALIAADMMAGMQQQPAFNYSYVSQSSEHFADAIESALRFENPGLLRHAVSWQWNARAPDGPSVLLLQQQVKLLAQAVQHRVAVDSRLLVGSYVANIASSLELHKDYTKS